MLWLFEDGRNRNARRSPAGIQPKMKTLDPSCGLNEMLVASSRRSCGDWNRPRSSLLPVGWATHTTGARRSVSPGEATSGGPTAWPQTLLDRRYKNENRTIPDENPWNRLFHPRLSYRISSFRFLRGAGKRSEKRNRKLRRGGHTE